MKKGYCSQVRYDLNTHLRYGGNWVGLFISIVASAMGNAEPSVFHVVDEAVFLVDSAAVFALQVAGKGFRSSNPFHAAVPFDILDELVDPF